MNEEKKKQGAKNKPNVYLNTDRNETGNSNQSTILEKPLS